MKTKSSLTIIISTLLIVVGVIVSSILTDYASTISTIVTTITAIIGAVALWIQFQKDREINQSSFIIEFYKSFYENDTNVKMLNILDKKYSKLDYEDLRDSKFFSDILNYLGWIRTLCNLIDRKVVTFETIDEIFGYKFFMIVNNKEIQDVELCKYSECYAIIYRTHKKWTDYRKKHNLNLIMEEEDLSKTKEYKKMFML